MPFGRIAMCHMLSDSHEELMAMADMIGVQRKWLQHAGTPIEHFDICLSKRAQPSADEGIRHHEPGCGPGSFCPDVRLRPIVGTTASAAVCCVCHALLTHIARTGELRRSPVSKNRRKTHSKSGVSARSRIIPMDFLTAVRVAGQYSTGSINHPTAPPGDNVAGTVVSTLPGLYKR